MDSNHTVVAWVSIERGLGLVAGAIGLLGLAGWAFEFDALKDIVPRGVTMKANTALCFLACGIAVMASSGAPAAPRRHVVMALSAAVALIGGLSLAEELFDVDFGIDTLLFHDAGIAGSIVRRGRMSPATAYCFIATAIALALSVMPERLRLQLPLAAALGASVTVVGIMLVAAYVSHRVFGYNWGATTTMALFTSFAFALLGSASLLRTRRLQRSEWALGKASTAGFLIGMVTMLGVAELATSFAKQMEESTSRVVATQQTLQVLQEIRTDMRTLESAQRGHLLLGDENFIAAREAGKIAVHRHLVELAAMQPTDAIPGVSLAQLRQAIEARLAFGDKLVAIRRTEGFEAARVLFNSGEDVALTQSITNTIAPLAKHERDWLVERQQHLKAVTTTTFLLMPIGSFLGLTALLVGLFFLDDGYGRQRRAQQALHRSRAQLQVVFDNMAEGIRVIDESGAIVQMNPAGASVHGLIEAATTLHGICEQVDATTTDGRVLAEDEWPAMQALKGVFVRELELRFERKDRSRFVLTEITTAPLPTEPGQPLRVVVTSHDVTQRKRVEAAVRQERERLEHVVENLTAGVMIHGLTGDDFHWNRAALAMFGLTRERVAGKSRDDFRNVFELSTLEGRVLAHADWPMSRVLSGDALQRIELRVRRLDFDWERVFAYEGAAVREARGSPLVFLTVTDITARSIAEMQLHTLNVELEQRVAQRTFALDAKTRELESFCYSVSHDLKAPLRGIDGYSRLLAEEYRDKLDDDGRMFIVNVRTAAAQMNALIDDLLAYSQHERRTLVPTSIPLRDFIATKVSRRAADLAQVTLRVDVQDVAVFADREGLAVALRNLIDNAVKFSARATPPRVGISTEIHEDKCVIAVQDNGTGFDMRYYDKIFEIFQRLHRAEDYPGTGVGLAMVRKAMERMGGRVWATSSPGQGATFFLELELAHQPTEVAP